MEPITEQASVATTVEIAQRDLDFAQEGYAAAQRAADLAARGHAKCQQELREAKRLVELRMAVLRHAQGQQTLDVN